MTTQYSKKRRVVYACLALRAVDGLGIALPATPLLQLIETNVCRGYYRGHNDSHIAPDGSISDRWCKVAEVQSEISYINGTGSILTLIPGILIPPSRVISCT